MTAHRPILPDSRRKEIARIRHFNRFYTNILGVLDQHYLKSVFSLSEGRVLFEIHHHPDGTANHIKSLLNMDEAYLSRILKNFVTQKLVTKTRMFPDGRSFALKLTAKGEKAFQQLNAASELGIDRVTGHLSDTALERMAKEMTRIEESLSQKEPTPFNLDDIYIRTTLQSGDMGYVTYLHGKLYKEEFACGMQMEAYIMEGLFEFYRQYDPQKDRVWICEHDGRIIGSLFLMHRGKSAQLRYFLIEPAYRKLGLGSKLMELYMDFLRSHHYTSSYLWTISDLHTAAKLYKRHGFHLTEEKETMTMGRKALEQRYDINFL